MALGDLSGLSNFHIAGSTGRTERYYIRKRGIYRCKCKAW